MREFLQSQVILTILRVCWGGSVLQLLTPDPLNLLNLVNPVNPVRAERRDPPTPASARATKLGPYCK